jgi:hypothetical protein
MLEMKVSAARRREAAEVARTSKAWRMPSGS